MTEVVHACPANGRWVTACCHKTPFELPRNDRMTLDPDQVTCGAVVSLHRTTTPIPAAYLGGALFPMDLLITTYADGTVEAAVRPGPDRFDLRWSPPVTLTPQAVNIE